MSPSNWKTVNSADSHTTSPPCIAAFLVKGLQRTGYAVDVAGDGRSGLTCLRRGHYDGAIIDLMLPQFDGLRLLQTAREEGIATPVLILSA